MKISIYEIEDWERASFQPLEAEHDVIYNPNPLDEDSTDFQADADIISVFVNSRVNATVLQRYSALKLVTTRSTGSDHIDLEYCKQAQIPVSNVPAYGETTVAEHVFALLLAISRKLIPSVEQTRKGNFSTEDLMGFDLMGKTLGVVGTGGIGQKVIRIAKGFDMKIIAFDLRQNLELATTLGFTYVSLDDLLATSDIISLHVPANKDTQHLIGEAQFALMKKGVVLINTARGTLIDIEALLKALAEKKVAAAGLDVLPEEPALHEDAEVIYSLYKKKYDVKNLLADYLLLQNPNVIITPHNAFNTREAIQRILDTTIANIVQFLQGQPQNTLTK